MYKIDYSQSARKDLKMLESIIAQSVIAKIEFYARQENPLLFAVPLQNTALGHYRFRIGDYRALFDITPLGEIKILLILAIKHRREAYN